ncbi:hypothetical protein Sp245p_03400 [Azospirillum baldaniorum]|uniref:Uncharacterized protein n=1 Tax=Azospirillum baldaniorum TaxID=1064539 RepID=A0A9P1NN72_9PROT|nr:hypothetical protein [Azospirillum baldaniorum]AWJ88900.1 hypothetical protein Sp245p_03400 [Azospirillum baldaniorum]TWA73390.1 hypothetical protein FBZ85_11682 [Azospirillum brasilense]CCC99393.1 protein of unknown function [Azospirillum baldaniorum]
MTPKFITLTDVSGQPELVNADHITKVFARGDGGSRVVFLNDVAAETYREDPAQIAALLGVTADPVRDAAPELLSELRDLVEWLEANQRSIEVECLTEDLLQGPRAALSAATGQEA